MELEWDEDKRRQGIAKHGVDLLHAAKIFVGPVACFPDSRADYGELREVAIGRVQGDLFVVVFTRRGEVFRLISARKGGRRDRRRYQESNSG